MSYPTDEYGARVPVYVVTPDGEIVREESPEGFDALSHYAMSDRGAVRRGIQEATFFPAGFPGTSSRP